MLNVILDTNIYRKNPSLGSASFKALQLLASNGHLHLHIPYIVFEEFISQKKEEYEKYINNIEIGIRGLSNKRISKKQKKILDSFATEIDKIKQELSDVPREEFKNWSISLRATLHPLGPYVEKAFEAYFKGAPPFKEKKLRKDIPDALIYETIKAVSEAHESVYIVVEDGNLREFCAKINNAIVFSSLDDLIGSDVCQLLLREQNIVDNFDGVINALKIEERRLNDKLESLSIDALAFKTFSDYNIPDDNNEATIESVGSLDNVEFVYEKAIYFGNGIVGLPFEFDTEVLAFYYIFKSDYYGLERELIKQISVSDYNDHYFEAEQYFYVHVTGLLSININIAEIKEGVELDSLVDYESCKIDEIESIEVTN